MLAPNRNHLAIVEERAAFKQKVLVLDKGLYMGSFVICLLFIIDTVSSREFLEIRVYSQVCK